MSPFTALSLLESHRRRLLTLSEPEFERAFDRILEALESYNDEKPRTTPKGDYDEKEVL